MTTLLPPLSEDALWFWAGVALGPFVGSFLGLVSLRLPQDRPVIAGRSACDGCGRKLGPLDLVPLISFAASVGKCRTCAAPIPRRYPLFEAGCLALAAWSGAVVGGPEGFVGAILAWWLLLIAVIDAEHFWLPDRLTLPLAALGLLVAAAAGTDRLVDHAIGAAAGFGALWLLALVYQRLRGREGLGGGDARLLAASGAWVGWAGLPSVLLWASAAGLSVALAMLVARRAVRADTRLPFGTFLAAGTWLTWLYGPLGL